MVMFHHRGLMFAALALGAACIAAPSFEPSPGDASAGYSERPVGTLAAAQTVPGDTIQFFRNKNFEGDMTQISEVTGKPPWGDHDFESKAKHFSSLRWNLPRGVIVSLFTRQNNSGKSLAIWGSGEIAELSKWKMNDELSGWAWNGVGGVAAPSQRIKDGRSERPKYAKTTDGVADGSIQCFKSRDAKGDMTPIENITDRPANAMHEMPKGTSSLKWKLEPGVVVVFSEEGSAVGPNLAIWGDGLFDNVSLWEMNDKLRYWSWHYLGDPR